MTVWIVLPRPSLAGSVGLATYDQKSGPEGL